MPPKKRHCIGAKTSGARRMAAYRAAETSDQRKARLEEQRARNAASRAAETLEQRKTRLENNRMRAALRRLFQGRSSKKSLRSCDRNKEETESVAGASELVLNRSDDRNKEETGSVAGASEFVSGPERGEKSVRHVSDIVYVVSDIVYVVDELGDNSLNEDTSDTEKQHGTECNAKETEDPLSRLDVKPNVETVVKEEEDSSARDEDDFVQVKEEIEEAPGNMHPPL
ncbi:uncharacterized protein [Macrobrachium rosenbergii]|uniref:uncharacterized protein isoform X3 n=1 Tax=Macrobrachium rosenbergii TaxID=79674 RepID=UPI0034D6D46D